MKKKLTLILSIIFSIVAIFPFTSCTNTKISRNKNTIRINEVTHSIFYAPLYLAESLGYFKENNLTIELTNGGGADNVMASVLSQNTDIGFCGPESAIYIHSGGSTNTPKVFAQLTKRDGSFLISRTNEKNFQWENLKNKEILSGRKGGVPSMTFEYVVNKHGLKNGINIKLNSDVQFNLMTSAFESGLGDYCTMFEPTASQYVMNKKGYIVASVGMESGEVPYTCFIAKESWLKRNESTTVKFLKSLIKAINFIKKEPVHKTAQKLINHFESTPVPLIESSLINYIKADVWTKDLKMEESSFNRLQDIIENAGELSSRIDFNILTDNSYIEKALNELKKE